MFVIALAIRADTDAKNTNNSINMNKGRLIRFLIAFILTLLLSYLLIHSSRRDGERAEVREHTLFLRFLYLSL